jgi:hypothetical protein
MAPRRNAGISRVGFVLLAAIVVLLLGVAGWVAMAEGTTPAEPGSSQAAEEPAAPKDTNKTPAAVSAHKPVESGRVETAHDDDPFGSGPLDSVGFEIAGRVVDTQQKPTAKAEVTLYVSQQPLFSTAVLGTYRENGVRVEEYTKKTGADGAFKFRGPFADSNDYLIVVRYPERAPATRRGFAVDRGERTDVGDLVLDAGFEIRGTVFGADGSPLAGARVAAVATPTFWNVERFLEQTDPEDCPPADNEGQFKIPHLNEGRFVVIAWAKGYARGTSPPITLSAEAANEPVSLHLATGAEISGKVVNAEGAGIPGAKVRVRFARDRNGEIKISRGLQFDASGSNVLQSNDSTLTNYPILATTDAAGLFQAEGLVAATLYEVSATADGYRKGGAVSAQSGTSGLAIMLRPNFQIRGTLVDAESGAPIAGAYIARYQGRLDELKRGIWSFPKSEGTSDSSGRFTASNGDKPGPAQLLAWFPIQSNIKNPGYGPSMSEPFTIDESQEIAEVTIKMTRGAAVAGTVTSGATGSPMPGAAVLLYATRDPATPNPRPYMTGALMGRASAASNGFFAFEGLLPGFYTIEVRTTSAGATRNEIFAINQGQRIENMRIVVPIPGTIRGTIVSNGNFAPVRVTATRADGLQIAKFAESDNQFSLDKLAPGLYRVRAERIASFDEGGFGRRWNPNDNSVTVDLKDGQVITLTLDIPESSVGKIMGNVTDNSLPGAGYTIAAIRENPSQPRSLNGGDQRDPAFGDNPRTTTADMFGYFEFPGMREGNYRIYAIPRGKGVTPKNAVASEQVQVFGNSNIRRDLFGRSGPLKGRVTRSTGQAISNATVTATVNGTRSPTPALPAGTRFTTRTKGDGTFNFGKLPGGAYDLTVEYPGFTKKTVGAEIYGANDENTQITLDSGNSKVANPKPYK